MAAKKPLYREACRGHLRTDGKKRYQYASLVGDSFLRKNITRAEVTARDIANYHNLTGKFSRSTSAMLIFFIQQLHQGRPGLDGIFQERWRKKKLTIPPGYTIELIDGARGLRYFFYVIRDSTGEDTFFSNMPGVVTVHSFLHWRQAASRDSR